MPTAHAGVEKGGLLWLARRALFCIVDLSRLRADKILQFLRKRTFGVALDPISAERIVDHIPYDPVRRKQLRRSRNIFLFDYPSMERIDHFFVLFRNIILIQPADDLNLAAAGDIEVFLGDVVHQVIDDALAVHHRQAEQKFGVVARSFKQSGQQLVQGVALLDKEETEQLVDGVVLLHPRNFCPLPFRKDKIGIEGAGDKVGL